MNFSAIKWFISPCNVNIMIFLTTWICHGNHFAQFYFNLLDFSEKFCVIYESGFFIEFMKGCGFQVIILRNGGAWYFRNLKWNSTKPQNSSKWTF
jgi:hypothetical protein